MLYKDINKKFTEIVMQYLTNGYYINTMSQRGSQGEDSKIDVTNGKEIIRIISEKFYNTKYTDDGFSTSLQGVKIMVGRSTDNVSPNEPDDYRTIWNDKLEVIKEEFYYQVGETGRNGNKCFGTLDEAVAAQKKHYERYQSRRATEQIKVFPKDVYEIVLPVVKRQPRCKTTKLSDIENVYSIVFKGHKTYYVKAKGRKYVIR